MKTHHLVATVQALTSGQHLTQAALLYRTVFGYTDPVDGISPRLLRSLVDNGGLVVGALDSNNEVVGFSYGFLGTDAQGTFHYSQAAAVSASFQGQQLGRRLKQEQARLATLQGLSRMQWAYDPVQVRNAHFNVNILGAYGIKFVPDYYQNGGSDRVIVQWDLSAPGATSAASANNPGGETFRVEVSRALAGIRDSQPEMAERMSSVIRKELQSGFERGLLLTSCELTDHVTATYVFTSGPRNNAAHGESPTMPDNSRRMPA
ncbi:hypothetical protein QEH68_20960 [Paenarthrobacter sp. OM7]|uniref:GNAT family N-acetyltransferase n=1 Tax=Paenarthrobacter sp. AMU7 TaxID=3162492 RepID=A0AB39YNE1_9MICC|nr:GNAT family N-acetyltransferase [Paenarthrobacter sp. OM7]WGM20453.1 hypothetical protein QEH68_20960 [Paenarthrobacter sp. OM7]